MNNKPDCGCGARVELLYFGGGMRMNQIGLKCTRCEFYSYIKMPDHFPKEQKDKYAYVILRKVNDSI